MHSVSLQYSVDGTNFSTAIAYSVLEIWLELVPEIETEGSTSRRMGVGAPKCVKTTPRMKGSIKFAWSNFNMAENSSGNNNMKALQFWACAQLKRIYFSTGSYHFPGGWDTFDSSSNTNYVDIDSIEYTPVKAFNSKTTDATGRKIVDVVVEFTVRIAPTVTKWNGSAFV